MPQNFNHTPLVSVIIPTFNRAYCIERAINSVLNQTYHNIEIIVIDNFSDDETKNLIKKLNKKNNIFFFKVKNSGIIAKSRNYGVKKAKGDFLAFLDSDDWWTKDKIEVSLNYLLNGYDIIYHDLFSVFKKKKIFKNLWKIRTRQLTKPVYKDLLLFGNAINNSSVVLNKAIFDNIRGFSEDPNLISSEDYDAWIRFSKITDNFYKINKTLGYYWQGGGNTSSLNLTLKSMNQILINYQKDISAYSKDGSAGFNYTISRSYYNVSDFKNSIKYSKKIIFKKVPSILYLKAIITIMQSAIYYFIYIIKVKIF